jgi:hypothetical protein
MSIKLEKTHREIPITLFGRLIQGRKETKPMPTIAIQFYPPKMQEFIAHWTQVNAVLGASPLLLKGGYTLATFTADRAAIVSAIDAVIPAVNTVQGAIVSRDALKTTLKTKIAQFRAAVNAFFPDSRYSRMIPTAPSFSTNESAFLAPFVDISNVWGLINTETNPGFTPPLLLPGGYTKANLDADIGSLRGAYTTLENANVGASGARASRDVLLPNADARMKQYRQAVIARLPVGSPLLNNIPSYSPNTGPAAQPVNPSIVWDNTKKKAIITWAASASTNVADYSIRTAPPPSWNGDNESVVGSVKPDAPLVFETDAGLTAAGSTALFKVYVVTETGREKGSIVLKITHPA